MQENFGVVFRTLQKGRGKENVVQTSEVVLLH